MEKKGISPLIATVLLIGFTIVLAAVVMRWGGEFVRETTEETACETELSTSCIRLRFEIESVVQITDPDTGIDTADITISSRSDKVIDGFRFIVWKGTEVDNTREALEDPLEPYTTTTYNMGFSSGTVFEDITSIEAIPIISVEGCDRGTCSESGTEYELP